MGNRSRRELEGQAILRDMLAHLPRAPIMPRCDLCGEVAAIGAYDGPRARHFCQTHRDEAYRHFGLSPPN